MITKPEWDYDPAWIEWNKLYPGRRSVGAAAADGDGGGEGEGEGEGAGGEGGGDGDPPGGEEGREPGEGDKGGEEGRPGSLFKGDKGEGDGPGREVDPKHQAAQDDPRRPEEIPAKFWDAEKGEVRSSDLAKSYRELEAQLGKVRRAKGVGDDVPETPEGYLADTEWKMPEGTDRVREFGADDPALKVWAEVCHKHGIGKSVMMEAASEFLAGINDSLPEPINPELERESLGENADTILQGVETWFTGLFKGGAISPEQYNYCLSMGSTAEGVRMLATFRELMGEKPLPFIRDAKTGGDAMSEAEWHSAYKDAVRTGNYSEQERLDKLGEEIFGTAPAGTSNSGYRPKEPVVDRRSARG